MVDLLYDGTFEGFLCCIYVHYYEEKATEIHPREEYQSRLDRGFRIVETCEEQAEKVYHAISKKISSDALKRVYRVWLSTAENKENMCLRYLVLGFRLGSAVDLLHADPVVFEMQQTERSVALEVHRFIGLVRFQEFYPMRSSPGDVIAHLPKFILYSGIEPDHDILELMADHFSIRYRNELLLIHDKRRGKAVFSEGGNWYVAPFDQDQVRNLGQGDKLFEILWREYYHGIAIKERTNPRCQKRFMPVRYWKNLTEMK